jgi:hypothetical protein
MVALIFLFLNLVASLFKSRSRLEAENAALRQQLIVLQRKIRGRVEFTNSDRLFFIQLKSLVSVCPQDHHDHPARDAGALASCRLTLFPDFARAGASGSERMRCAARKPRITAPGREKLQGAEQQG